MKNIKNTVIIFLILFAVAIFGVLIFTKDGAVDDQADFEEIQTSLTVDYGNSNIESYLNESIREGSSVFDLLMVAERRHGLSVEYQEFAGVGVFVESIRGAKGTGDSFWQYWVNNEHAQVGASQYILKDGDEVLWKRTGEMPE